MSSVAVGVGYSLWWRGRWTLMGIFAYLFVLAVGVQWFPEAGPVICMSAAGLMILWANLLSTVSLGPADFGAKASGFPTHMMVLPARTRALVGWPMIFGMAIGAALWCLATELVLRPGGVQATVVWPAVLIATATAWVQALSWTPFPTPWVRAPALLVTVLPVAMLAAWGGVEYDDARVSQAVTAIGIGWAGVAYVVGVHGLARARCGQGGDWFQFLARRGTTWIARRSASGEMQSAPFRSARSAQFWYEFRRNAIALPLLVAFASLPILGILLLSVTQREQSPGLMIDSILIKSEILVLGAFLFGPMLLGSMMGSGMGKFDIWGKSQMPAFFGTRPMPTLEYVLLKFKAAGIAAALTWGILLTYLAVWAALDASPLNLHKSLVRAAWAEATPRNVVGAILCVVGLWLFLWRGLVVGFWVTFSGRKWLANVVGVALPLAALALAGKVFWIYRNAVLREWLVMYAPWLLGGILGLKICAAIYAGINMKRLGLAGVSVFLFGFGGWVIAATIICLAIAIYVPLTPLIVLAVALQVPLARISVAPLMLHWNRHR